jgi:hypothetical protein
VSQKNAPYHILWYYIVTCNRIFSFFYQWKYYVNCCIFSHHNI